MTFDGTLFPYCEKFCKSKYGKEDGKKIFDNAQKLLDELCEKADDRGNNQIRWHLDMNMLPAISLYKTLIAYYKDDKDKALTDTDQMMQIMRLETKEKNKHLGAMFCGYGLFKMFVKKHMNKHYPSEGWNVKWVKKNSKEIHFNMKSCIYVDVTKQCGCPELCPLFCKNDDVTMSGYMPGIKFERKGTLALGADVCDFHYLNTKKI